MADVVCVFTYLFDRRIRFLVLFTKEISEGSEDNAHLHSLAGAWLLNNNQIRYMWQSDWLIYLLILSVYSFNKHLVPYCVS